MPGYNPGGFSSGGLGPGGNDQSDSNSRNEGRGALGRAPAGTRGGSKAQRDAERARRQKELEEARKRAEENARMERKARALKARAEAQKLIEARKRSSAGVGGRRSAVGFATLDQELDATGFFETLINHFFTGLLPGLDKQAQVDFATNKKVGDQITFGAAEFVGDVVGALAGVPFAGGQIGNKIDQTLGSKTGLGSSPQTGAKPGGGTLGELALAQADPIGVTLGGVPGTPGGSGVQVAGGEKLGGGRDAAASNNFAKSNTKPPSLMTTKTQNRTTLSGFETGFGDENRNPTSDTMPKIPQGVFMIKPAIPKTPVKPNKSNGTGDDDLFELYRRMLGGFFQGVKV